MTLQECAAAAARRLAAAGFAPADSRVDVGVFARALLGWDQTRWLADGRVAAPAGFASRLDTCVERRARGEPVAYIVGEREFFGRPFHVTPAVLVPRPETELLVSAVLDRLAAPAPMVVDVGTGSGCVAVTLAAEAAGLRLVATDVSAPALDVARRNARRHGVADRIEFRAGSLLAGFGAAPDVIVSNPPYVGEAERGSLPRDVVEYEPAEALFAGPDGLDVIRPLIEVAARGLAPDGWLMLEIGAGQAEDVGRLLAAAGAFVDVDFLQDLSSHPRVLVARRAPFRG